MDFWRENIDKILLSNGQKLLVGSGSVSNLQMESIVHKVYDEFDKRRKQFDAEEADKEDMLDLLDLDKELKKRN